MTVAWMVLMVLGGLVSSAAFVWLLVIAFRESTAWGLACLFIPFAALIFAFKFWENAKLPLVGCVGGSMLAVFGAVGFSMTSVNVGIDEYADLGEQVAWESPSVDPIAILDNENEDEFDPSTDDGWVESDAGVGEVDDVMKAAADLRTSDHEEALSALDEPDHSQPPPRPHRDGALVPVEKLATLKGERVVIVLHTLERVSAYVVGVDEGTAELRQRVGGGSVTYTIDLKDIKEVRSRKVP